MGNNNNSFFVYAETMNNMTAYEKEKLMDELAALMQNHEARVEVAQEKGFPYLWRVLTGKQTKLQNQILVDQAEINQIIQILLTQLWQGQTEQLEDLNAMQRRVLYLEKITALHSMYIIRLSKELGGEIDIAPLQAHLDEMMKEEENLSRRIATKVSPSPAAVNPKMLSTNEQIRMLAGELLRNGADFENFISKSSFKMINWELQVMDWKVYWDVVYQVDGWQIQQWKNDLNHYRILNPQKIRKAWTADPNELINVLQNYKRLLTITG